MFLVRLCDTLTPSGIRFNKRREDFPDLRSYNDYLQQVEDISKCHIILPLLPPMFFTKNNKNNTHHFRVHKPSTS
jgi:hypothetical protein